MKGVDHEDGGEKLSLSLGGPSLEPCPSMDLLKRFMDQQPNVIEKNNEGVVNSNEDHEELELSLSLNGIYGVDPTRKKLKRSSSISNLGFTVGGGGVGVDYGTGVEARGGYAPLFRTSSLPSTKGKELVSVMQMEARQKRMKKRKNLRLVKDKENENENGVDGVDGIENGNVNVNGNGTGSVWPSSQGSMGSQGSGGSSGFDDFQSQQIEVARQMAEAKSPSNQQALPAQVEQQPATRPADSNVHVTNQLIKMPYVSLRGDAGNGKKTEGFLYRYNKGDDIRIVCVCHGLFLSPAEFVKHGGGGDVEHPLKHIVVNPSPLF